MAPSSQSRTVAGVGLLALLSLCVTSAPLAQGAATLEVAPGGAAPAGSTVTVRWSGPNAPGDYITVVRKGAPAFEYLNYKPTSDGRTPVNPVSIVLPAEPGAYEIRYLFSNPRRVLAVVPYQVTAIAATIDGPASVAPGARFEVSWTGPNNGGDWVTIVAAGAAARAYGSYVDARIGNPDSRTGSRTAELRAPADPGRYELRYVQQGRVVIGTRTIEVAAGVAGGAAPGAPAAGRAAAGAAAAGGAAAGAPAAGGAAPGASAARGAAAGAPAAGGAAAGASAAGGAAAGTPAAGGAAAGAPAAGGAAAGTSAAGGAAAGAPAAGTAAAGAPTAGGAAAETSAAGGAAAGSSTSSAPQLTVIPFIQAVQALPAQTPSPTSSEPLSKTPGAANSPTVAGGGGLTAAPAGTTAGVTAATARDPAGFRAQQYVDPRGDFAGTVELFWGTVSGASAYMLGGPGTGTGVRVTNGYHRLTGVPPGTHTWTIATMYPNGILTTPDTWSKATTTVKAVTARYRIVLNGFRVYQESYDDQLNMDGQHDEVYAAVAVAVFEQFPRKVLLPTQIVRSALHGDASRGQVQVTCRIGDAVRRNRQRRHRSQPDPVGARWHTVNTHVSSSPVGGCAQR